MEILIPQDHHLWVQADPLGVGTEKALHEHRGGKGLGVAILDGLEHSHADPGFSRDFLQADPAVEALFAEVFAKGFHIRSLWIEALQHPGERDRLA
jgi:hypothetical protein